MDFYRTNSFVSLFLRFFSVRIGILKSMNRNKGLELELKIIRPNKILRRNNQFLVK